MNFFFYHTNDFQKLEKDILIFINKSTLKYILYIIYIRVLLEWNFIFCMDQNFILDD